MDISIRVAMENSPESLIYFFFQNSPLLYALLNLPAQNGAAQDGSQSLWNAYALLLLW